MMLTIKVSHESLEVQFYKEWQTCTIESHSELDGNSKGKVEQVVGKSLAGGSLLERLESSDPIALSLCARKHSDEVNLASTTSTFVMFSILKVVTFVPILCIDGHLTLQNFYENILHDNSDYLRPNKKNLLAPIR